MDTIHKKTSSLQEFKELYEEYQNRTWKDDQFMVASWGAISFVFVDHEDGDKHKLIIGEFGSQQIDALIHSLRPKEIQE